MNNMKFLIQTIDNKIVHDFCFTLIESIKYQIWLNKSPMDGIYNEKPIVPGCIPIGTVEFVSTYFKTFFNREILPKNIPNELLRKEFTGRHIINGTERDIKDLKFVKSNTKIKDFTEICKKAPKGNYQISEIIDIKSEWRVFVFNKTIVGVKNYVGDYFCIPNKSLVYDMINAYESQPISYTIDVAITEENETVIIEVHDFFSCGLYGFSDHRILPFMFSKWFYEFIYSKSIEKIF